MAAPKKAPEAEGTNTAAVNEGAGGDKVAMLSLNKDGTPDQHNPELIGDEKFAREATRRQFAEQAISAHDDAAGVAVSEGAEKVEQDPTIAARQAEHQKISEAAEKRADSVVDSLYKG